MIRLKKFVLSLKPVQWFLVSVLPHVRFSVAPPKMTGDKYMEFLERLEPGDIVFSNDRSKLAGMLIPGRWDHCGVFIGAGIIIEAHQPTVRKTTVFDFCHTSDEVGIGRHRLTPFWRDILESAVGTPYDSWFEDDVNALYCSELVAELYPNRADLDYSDTMGLGSSYISPDGIWESMGLEKVMG